MTASTKVLVNNRQYNLPLVADFISKQVSAGFFGAVLLSLMVLTKSTNLPFPLLRYDFLFICALVIQGILYFCQLESLREMKVILIFHLIATLMEIFKTSPQIQSWAYPESAVFAISGVPLFTGFMYSAVGSYIARSWRLFDLQFSFFPRKITCLILAMTIYINFFTHHFTYDYRWLLIALTWLLFARCRIAFKLGSKAFNLSVLIPFLSTATLIWLAENICTYTGIWYYPGQQENWTMVSLHKIPAWYLLMLVSFILVSLVHKPQKLDMTGRKTAPLY